MLLGCDASEVYDMRDDMAGTYDYSLEIYDAEESSLEKIPILQGSIEALKSNYSNSIDFFMSESFVFSIAEFSQNEEANTFTVSLIRSLHDGDHENHHHHDDDDDDDNENHHHDDGDDDDDNENHHDDGDNDDNENHHDDDDDDDNENHHHDDGDDDDDNENHHDDGDNDDNENHHDDDDDDNENHHDDGDNDEEYHKDRDHHYLYSIDSLDIEFFDNLDSIFSYLSDEEIVKSLLSYLPDDIDIESILLYLLFKGSNTIDTGSMISGSGEVQLSFAGTITIGEKEFQFVFKASK